MPKQQQQIVIQSLQYLTQLSDAEYCQVGAGVYAASPGKHMRHLLDHYQALMHGWVEGLVDYRIRARGSLIEKKRLLAISEWQKIQAWLDSLSKESFSKPLQVMGDFQGGAQGSTLGRELAFLASHALHHFSLLAVMAKSQGAWLPDNFGVAPSTLAFQGDQA